MKDHYVVLQSYVQEGSEIEGVFDEQADAEAFAMSPGFDRVDGLHEWISIEVWNGSMLVSERNVTATR